MLKLIVFLILIFFLIFLKLKKEDNFKEHFTEGNFALCKQNDCKCLKMNTAPDGTCVLYKVQHKPLIPDYKDKKYYKPYVVRNNKYPKKRQRDMLIFVGKKIKNTKNERINAPSLLKFMYPGKQDNIYSLDKKTTYLLDVFLNAIDILKILNKDDDNPYFKYLILDSEKHGYEKQVLNSYELNPKELPVIYLFNQKKNERLEFKYTKKEKR